ncbi:MAG: lytic transglycosylase domain-containing protein [Lacisediminihabitans sp.]
MGRHTGEISSQAPHTGAGAEPFGWRIRNRGSVSVFAFFAAAAFMALAAIAPNPQAIAAVESQPSASGASQGLIVSAQVTGGKTVTGEVAVAMLRDDYTVTKRVQPRVLSAAPVAGVPDPGSAQAIGHELVLARGWGEDQYSCLVSLFNRESHWNVYAGNPVSGAYGIPQALPGTKMASAGADWQSNPRTQITWGLGYIASRYGTPCGAWGHSQASGWY